MRKYIVTGGPCTGKSTLLRSLRDRGMKMVGESARPIIRHEKKKGENGVLPWTDLKGFQENVISYQQRKESRLDFNEDYFLDRSIVDCVAYAELGGVSLNDSVYGAIRDADYTRVFFLDQLPFYEQDSERRETKEEAQKIHEKLYEVYDRFGFDIVTVPAFEPSERIDHTLEHVLLSDYSREREGKFSVCDLDAVRSRLDNYFVECIGEQNEVNTMHDLFSLFERFGFTFRLRDKGDYVATVKGKDIGESFSNRFEYEKNISPLTYHVLQKVFPQTSSYVKYREMFRPLGDSSCTICLDTVEGLGSFVEIEAGSENQITLWKERLGLEGDSIKIPYYKLVKEVVL